MIVREAPKPVLNMMCHGGFVRALFDRMGSQASRLALHQTRALSCAETPCIVYLANEVQKYLIRVCMGDREMVTLPML